MVEVRLAAVVVLAAVAQEGYALEYATDALKGDRDFMLAAVARNGNALAYASARVCLPLGDELERMRQAGGFGMEVVSSADHMFTLRRNQEQLIERVTAWM